MAALAFAALGFVGCKQDLGERCEKNDDCSTGLCNVSMTSAMAGICVTSTVTPFDASTGTVDAGNVGDATAPDAASDTHPGDASDGSADASPSDAGGDAGSAEVHDGAVAPGDVGGDVSSEVSSDLGSDATSDAGSDAALEAAAGG